MNLDRELAVQRDHKQLAAPTHVLEAPAGQGGEWRIERLECVDPRRERRLDLAAGDGGVDQARGDLDFRQLGHG